MKILDNIKSKLISGDKYWIVFTGDSITSCEWVHPNWRDILIYVLQSEMIGKLNGDWKTVEWGLRGFNFAYDGSTTKDILEKMDDILGLKPQLIIGLMGGNDPVMNISVSESVANISKIVEIALNNGSSILWCNSIPSGERSPKNDEYRPYARAFMEIPEKTGLGKIDMFNIYKNFPLEKFFTFLSEEIPLENIKEGDLDLQHPNQLGNAYIAKVILKEYFGIEFNPERYISDTNQGLKYPGY